MTDLSVNLNKIALLRNSRGRDYPNIVSYAQRFVDRGVQGITIHPRPDERHIKRQDAYDLAEFLRTNKDVELNIEGYPSDDFLQLIEATKPAQCTLVPDAENQLTSDHGWDLHEHYQFLTEIILRIKDFGVRTAIFLDPVLEQVELAAQSGCDRLELYTESYAEAFGTPDADRVFQQYREAAQKAQELGLGINAGHDLDLSNLAKFLTIPAILEVSIGHALTVECIDQGMNSVVSQYLAICHV
ncbi:pyridoxine 5'-phosphate synthase [Gammaproteobacteria bacterium]|nr:pyridoxine 5'-phosphate synthase [Gammaproteobacteria bacterium]